MFELVEMRPQLIAAVPVEAQPLLDAVVGDGVQPSAGRLRCLDTTIYRWRLVPAYVGRSLSASAAWVCRNTRLPPWEP